MKYSFVMLMLVRTIGYAQLAMEDTDALISAYKLGSYSYHEQFKGHKGYGAPIILTLDGGAAMFGDFGGEKGSHGLLVKVDKNRKEEWKRAIRPQFDEMESQSVIQDKNGNYFVFMISYDYKRYRGGCERIVCLDKKGTILWDKTIGKYELVNSPTFSYIRSLSDGRISLRGHMVTEKPAEGKDPQYHYWEGWINSQGKLTQKTGVVIDWANKEWEKKFKPD